MKTRIARLGVLIAGVLGLMATMTPAEATTIKTITFVGTADLTGGTLGYPCTPAGTTNCTTGTSVTTKPGLKGLPTVNITPGGNHASFRFRSNDNQCFKSSVSVNKTGTQNKNGVLEPCVIQAVGAVWGFCGLSTGEGIAELTNLAGTKTPRTVSIPFKFTGVGGLLHITGTADGDTRQLIAEVIAIPNPTPGTGSCTNKTANNFIIAGQAIYIDKT